MMLNKIMTLKRMLFGSSSLIKFKNKFGFFSFVLDLDWRWFQGVMLMIQNDHKMWSLSKFILTFSVKVLHRNAETGSIILIDLTGLDSGRIWFTSYIGLKILPDPWDGFKMSCYESKTKFMARIMLQLYTAK